MQEFTKTFDTEADLIKFSQKLAKVLPQSLSIHLHGPLGAGKTLLARGIIQALGFDGKVKSPTYTLMETYPTQRGDIVHLDLYRISDALELEFLGLRDFSADSTIYIIEWPEKGYPLLPVPDLACYIEIICPGRKIDIKANTDRGAHILTLL